MRHSKPSCTLFILATAAISRANTFVIPHFVHCSAGDCVVWDASGGYPGWSVDSTPAPGWPKRQIGKPKFEDLSVSVTPGTTGGPLEFVSRCFDSSTPQTFNFEMLSPSSQQTGFSYSAVDRSFFDCTLTSVTFPACDASSKDPGYISMRINPVRVVWTSNATVQGQSVISAQRQKPWLAANFRLNIDGLDCSRVNKIEALVVKQSIADVDGDGVLDCVLDSSDLVFTLPAADVQDLIKHFENGDIPTEEQFGSLVLSDDKGNPLNTISFQGLFVTSVEPVFDPTSAVPKEEIRIKPVRCELK